MNQIIKCILLFLEVIFLLWQFYILYNYIDTNNARFKFRGFMDEINAYISQNKLDDYKKRFEDVFGQYSDSSASGQGFITFFIFITHFCVGLTLIIGVIKFYFCLQG